MATNNQNTDAIIDQAIMLHNQRQLPQARALYETALQQRPMDFDALNMLGLLLLQEGNFPAGVEYLKKAISVNPSIAHTHCNLGNGYIQLKDFLNAYKCFENALSIEPENIDSLTGQGDCLVELKDHEKALEKYDRAVQLNPNNFLAVFKMGIAFMQMRNIEMAIFCFETTQELNPQFPPAYTWHGAALEALHRDEEAFTLHSKAIQIDPTYAEAYFNRANARRKIENIELALNDYSKAIELNPTYIDALNNKGLILEDLDRENEALDCYRKCIAINPEYISALSNLANLLTAKNQHQEAEIYYKKILSLNPDFTNALGAVLNSNIYTCNWKDYNVKINNIIAKIDENKQVATPFALLSFLSSAEKQLIAAKQYIQVSCPPLTKLPWNNPRYNHDKIRVAYLSADFHNHATAWLTAGLFEHHDKERFSIYAISFGPDSTELIRTRLENSFDQFINVRNLSDSDVVKLLRNLEIDIAIDLKGLTGQARTGIFSQRAAPIQVNYLGYPGTMGAEYIDYIIADRFVIPQEHYNFYTEKVVCLPNTYQVNDSKRTISNNVSSRKDFGLPEDGFVFCSFNNNYKITPFIFDIWMRLLSKVENSVLWLLECNSLAKQNLLAEARSRGISPDRIIFAPPIAVDEHLARQKHADLFLDTLPVNAHTTASDALWSGLPIVTCMGDGFASRVAGSLLHAVGLPELVTHSLEDYENIALRLATNPNELTNIRSKLERNRTAEPLYNTELFRQHIEAAYIEMWKKHQNNELPTHIMISQ
jgi:protein O-GlcNAc transferase